MSNASLVKKPALLIQANAGTGKTFSLTNRFLWLVNQGEKPDRILATTFTKKAAGEISERIFFRLAEAVLDNEKAAKLGEHIDDDSFNSDKAADLLRSLIDVQHRLQILTLDSFFYRLALSFTLEVGLAPGWEIGDPAVETEIRREAVRRVCNEGEPENIIKLIRMLDQGSAKRSIQSRIETLVKDGFSLLRETSEEAWLPLARPELLEDGELKALIAKLSELEVPKTKAGADNKNWKKAVEASIKLARGNNWFEFIKQGIQSKILAGEDSYYKAPIEDSFYSVYEPLLQHSAGFILKILSEQTESSRKLLYLFYEEFLRNRESNRSLGFDDVKHELIAEIVWGNLDTLYYRLDSKIHHLLLDEFQDTSRLDWKVIKPLVDEVLSKASLEHSFFCVGDTKQAIYGWRGGEAKIFDSIPTSWSSVERDNLDVSYRSSPVISDFVNTVFSGLSSNPSLENYKAAGGSWQQRFSDHNSAKTEQPGCVSFELLPSEGKTQDLGFLTQVAERISAIQAAHPGFSIGILCRQNKLIGPIRYALSQRDIPASEEGGVKLTESDAVNAFLSLITLIDHPGDKIVRFHTASSPLGSILGYTNYKDVKSAHRLAVHLRKQVLQKGLGEFIQELISKFTDLSALDELRLGQLVETAYLFEAQPFSRLSDFVRFASVTKVEDANSAQVRVMTIHKSKGLEFDIVVLPELDCGIGPRGAVGFLNKLSSSGEDVERVSRSVSKEIAELNPELKEMSQQHSTSTALDALCALYVAVTRPKYALYMYAAVKKKAEFTTASFDGILINALCPGEADQLGVRFESGDENWSKGLERDLLQKGNIEDYRPSLKSAGKNRSRMLPRKAPSEEDAAIEDILNVRPETAEFGTTVHALFEEIEWIVDFNQDSIDQKEFTSLRSLSAEVIKGYLKKALSHQEIKQLLSTDRYQSWDASELKVFREKPFAFRLDGRICSGIIDRLVVGFKDGKPAAAEVIDFKTSSTENTSLEEIAERYKLQMSSYQQAIIGEFKLEQENVKTTIALVGSGELIEL